MVDQLGAKWLELGLGGIVSLPNFKRLRARGTSFSNAFTSNPVCCPARATIATGLTTRGHGVLENGYYLDPGLPTFMEALRDAGWTTGAFGKVHLQPHFAGMWPDYRRYGFDLTHITEDSRGGEWLDWVERTHPEHFEAALATCWATDLPDFEAYGPNRRNLRERIQQVQASFPWVTADFPENSPTAYTLPFPAGVSQTEWITQRALDFITSVPAERPFFAQVSYVQPHMPFSAPADLAHEVNVSLIPTPAGAEWRTDAQLARQGSVFTNRNDMTHSPEWADWQHPRRLYFADIAHLDAQLGRLLDALDESRRDRPLFIVFTSDHGELLFDHGFIGKEELHYDSCIRVPLTIVGPGIEKDAISTDIVQLEDVAPTVLDAAGTKLPDPPVMGPHLMISGADLNRLPGNSLLPLSSTGGAIGREAAYVESFNAIWSADPGDWARTVRTERYRYTCYPRGCGEQLFDLESDPDEKHNLVRDPAAASLRSDMRDLLFELIILQDHPKTRRSLFAFGVH